MGLERSVWIGRVFMCSWILFVIPSVVQVLQSGRSAAAIGITFAILSWAVLWVWFWMRALGSRPTAHTVGFAAITVTVLFLAFIAPPPVDVGGVIVFSFIIAGV